MATICIMILILFIGFWIFKSAMSKPYHYEGIVQSIRLDEKENAFLEVKSVHGDAVIKVKIENSMSFSFWDGSRMKAEDLRIGDIINANFKKRKDGDYYVVKKLKIYPSEIFPKTSNTSETT